MKLRILANWTEPFNRRLGVYVRYVRGDVVDADDFEPDVVLHLTETEGPRDMSEALGRLIAEHGEEWEARDRDGKMDWREPAWYRSRKIPAAEVYTPQIAKPKVFKKMPTATPRRRTRKKEAGNA